MHPFEKSGLGKAPFRFLRAVSLPSPSMAEHNPTAYNNEMRFAVGAGARGTCDHCGTAITHNFICASSDGREFAVGSDCVFKVGAKDLEAPIRKARTEIETKARRAKADAKKEARRLAWLSEVVGPDGQTREAKMAADKLAAEARFAAIRAAQEAFAVKWAPIAAVLETQSGGFCASIARDIRAGHKPQGRAFPIVRDIWCKYSGRAGSKAYEAAGVEFDTLTAD